MVEKLNEIPTKIKEFWFIFKRNVSKILKCILFNKDIRPRDLILDHTVHIHSYVSKYEQKKLKNVTNRPY